MIGPELVQMTSEKVPIIQQRLKIAFSRQKSYADPKRKDVLFSVGDLVFLKVSPMKGVMRFGKNGKLAPKYIRPFGWCCHHNCRGFTQFSMCRC